MTTVDKNGEMPRPERRRPLGRPGCRLCDGTGWQFIDLPVNSVVPCPCRDRWERENA